MTYLVIPRETSLAVVMTCWIMILLCVFSSQDVQGMWCILEQFIIYAMKLFIPLTKIHSHQYPQWFTPEIRH